MTTLTRKTEVRHLPSAEVFKIAQLLDSSQNWKKLLRIIPKKLEEVADIAVFGGKYNAEHIKIIENNKGNRLAAEVLIGEWGTSGRIRPNLSHLLQFLVKAELFRAAEYVACDLLNEPLPKRPEKGPAAKIDISLPPPDEAIGGILSNMGYPNSSNLNNGCSEMDNNRDFYDKWTPNDQQKMRLEEPKGRISENLIQFSVSRVSMSQDSNFSLHSDIVGNYGIVLFGEEDGLSSASRNIPSSIVTLSTDIPDTVTSNSDNNTKIPNTEINAVHRADPPEDTLDNLPHFSLLMPRANQAKSKDMDANISSDSETFQSTSEIISDNSIPNLPMLQAK